MNTPPSESNSTLQLSPEKPKHNNLGRGLGENITTGLLTIARLPWTWSLEGPKIAQFATCVLCFQNIAMPLDRSHEQPNAGCSSYTESSFFTTRQGANLIAAY